MVALGHLPEYCLAHTQVTNAMNMQITRRKFVAAAGIGALAGPSLAGLAENQAASQAPQLLTQRTVRPVVISAANGNRSKDGEGLTAMAPGGTKNITARA